jgi:hypothetical protein
MDLQVWIIRGRTLGLLGFLALAAVALALLLLILAATTPATLALAVAAVAAVTATATAAVRAIARLRSNESDCVLAGSKACLNSHFHDGLLDLLLCEVEIGLVGTVRLDRANRRIKSFRFHTLEHQINLAPFVNRRLQ